MRMIFGKFKENKDGKTVSVTVDYDKDVKELIKKHYNRKRITSKLVERFIIEGLTNYLKKNK
jgi:transcription antitermination factor NusG